MHQGKSGSGRQLSYGADTETALMRIEAALLRRLPPRLRRPARKLLYYPADLADGLLGRREELVPPRRLMSVGAGDFKATGEQYLRYLRDYCRLEPGSRVLDVGCGIGRMAVPMIRFLDTGTYDGLDVVADDIRWCRHNITRKYPHLRFQHVDVHHREYNPGGRLAAVDYAFPFADGSFEVVFASSLMSHFLAAEVEHYLAEIARVLAPGGACLITFFVLNEESRRLIASGACGLRFQTPTGRAYVHDAGNPEAAVAYDEPFIHELYQRLGLVVEEPLLYGCWCCRERFTSYQDIVIARAPDRRGR